MMPHLAETLYALLFPGDEMIVAELAWPEADPALLVAEAVTLAVQVGGKLRGTIEVPPGVDAETAYTLALAEPAVAKAIEGKRIVKRVHVPDRIVNFVVAG
jgi:leucyl-tRNA synthetase